MTASLSKKIALVAAFSCVSSFAIATAHAQAPQQPAASAAPVLPKVEKVKEKEKPATKKHTMKFKNDEDKMSYIIGHQIAASIMNDEIKINKDLFVKSLKDGLNGKKSEFDQQETQTFMQEYLIKQQKIRGEKNMKDGEKFLTENKTKPGVVTLPSGLQYKVITEGKGPKPKATDTVTVDYEGTLVNGKVFDSSYQRGQPVSFPVNGVIKGWTEALQLMPEGSTWMLYIPANIAYGEQAPSPLIGPNSTLVFKVHLISIAKPAAPAKPAAEAPKTAPTTEKK